MALSQKTQGYICDFLLTQARIEKKIEILRQLLVEDQNFEPYTVFKKLDFKKQGQIDASDINKFLITNNIIFSDQVIKLSIICQYDLDDDSKLNFSEFLRAVLPFDHPALRAQVVQRDTYNIDENIDLHDDIAKLLSRFFEEEIISCLQLENYKINIINQQDYAIQKLFAILDNENKGFIDFESLLTLMGKNNFYPYEEEIVIILRRFDRSDHGKLSFKDFSLGIQPKNFLKEDVSEFSKNPKSKQINKNYHCIVSHSSNEFQQIQIELEQHAQQSSSMQNNFPHLLHQNQINKQYLSDQILSSKQNLNNDINQDYIISYQRSTPLPYNNKYSPYNKLYDNFQNQNENHNIFQNINSLKSQTSIKLQNLEKSFSKGGTCLPNIENESQIQKIPTSRLKLSIQGSNKCQNDTQLLQYHSLNTIQIKEFLTNLQKIISFDNEVEKSKEELALHSDFNIEDLFKIITNANLQQLPLQQNLIKIFNVFQVSYTKENLKLFIHKFFGKNSTIIQQQNIEEIFIPNQQEYANLLSQRKTYQQQYNQQQIVFSKETQHLIQNILELQLINLCSIEEIKVTIKQKLNINIPQLFTQLDLDKDNFVSIRDIKKNLENCDLYYNEKEIALLFLRFDKDKDGRISINDLNSELLVYNT